MRAMLRKMREKLTVLFGQQKLYEAQQLYQTMFHRLAGKRQFRAAAELMFEGAMTLLQYQEGNAGGELAMLLIECWEKDVDKRRAKQQQQQQQQQEQAKKKKKQNGQSHEEAEDDAKETEENSSNVIMLTDKELAAQVEQITQLFAAFPKDDAKSVDVRDRFMRRAITYTGRFGANPHGSPALHQAMARELTRAERFAEAQRYWLRSGRPDEHAAMLAEWASRGYRGELDLFITRCVLQYLCLENLGGANAVFQAFITAHAAGTGAGGKKKLTHTPLLNFTRFLLLTLERDAAPLFRMLRSEYATSLERDDTFNSYLDKIGQLFYNIEAPKSMMEGLLDMFAT
eukprot:TRINITY_DN65566_c7_g4_i3.p1 TRINITY_DN65566_c7_g4~~TRINITY_DN65566_c7_g4_i3.p1  ORF type:complete len:384 (+),score=226.48 TRINITY_DN65566_c7_g4_i3:124-1152(+)